MLESLLVAIWLFVLFFFSLILRMNIVIFLNVIRRADSRDHFNLIVHRYVSVTLWYNPAAFTYSYEVQQLQKYSGIHVHTLIKRAVKAPIESIQRSIKLFINYASPYSFPSLLNLLTFCAASLSPTG